MTSHWPSEDILDDSELYKHIHCRMFNKKGYPGRDAFNWLGTDAGPGMSTNWSRYRNVEETCQQVAESGKIPDEYSVGMFIAGSLRRIETPGPDGFVVQHTPQEDNRAHTDVFGPLLDKADVLALQTVIRDQCKIVLRHTSAC